MSAKALRQWSDVPRDGKRFTVHDARGRTSVGYFYNNILCFETMLDVYSIVGWTPLKILFLDIDGVLNSIASRRFTGNGLGMGQSHVDELVRIIDTTGCQIVVSSAWRHADVPRTVSTHSAFGQSLRASGGGSKVLRAVVGVTDDKPDTRGDQISRWIDEHPGLTAFAIVDDEPLGKHFDQLVATSFETGLTVDTADAIIAMLNEGNCQ